MDDAQIVTSAVCGLFCEACGLYIASHEDEERLKKIAVRYGKNADDIRCNGCRSETLGPFCRTCKIKPCAAAKNIQFCSQCDEYPCDMLKEFQAQANVSHRLELWESLDFIKEHGYQMWHDKMREHYSCINCNTINSAYDLNCRKCNTFPANHYIEKNFSEIKRRSQV